MIGLVFGFLVVQERAGSIRFGKNGRHAESLWLCRCECGETLKIRRSLLISGIKRYCSREKHFEEFGRAVRAGHIPRTEGVTTLDPDTYNSWRAIKRRCSPGQKYHARGITMCERWRNYRDFLADMGPRPSPAHSIDREDTLGNYEPGNCRWATSQEQGDNKRSTQWVEWRGERRKLIELCREAGLPNPMVYSRLKRGWSVERAFAEPAQNSGSRRRATETETLGLFSRI